MQYFRATEQLVQLTEKYTPEREREGRGKREGGRDRPTENGKSERMVRRRSGLETTLPTEPQKGLRFK